MAWVDYSDAIVELKRAVALGAPTDDTGADLLEALNRRALEAQGAYLDAVGVEAEVCAAVAPRASA